LGLDIEKLRLLIYDRILVSLTGSLMLLRMYRQFRMQAEFLTDMAPDAIGWIGFVNNQPMIRSDVGCQLFGFDHVPCDRR
jgi:hypothetical protein